MNYSDILKLISEVTFTDDEIAVSENWYPLADIRDICEEQMKRASDVKLRKSAEEMARLRSGK